MTSSNARQPVYMSAPLAEFSKCHGQFVAQLHNALYLPDLVASAARARAMADDLLKLFHKGLLAHHEDEERELFPAVLHAAEPGDEALKAQAMVDQLVREHGDVKLLWKKIEPAVQGVCDGQLPELDTALLDDLVQHFFAHVHFEEEEFLPLAQHILERHNGDITKLGHALHVRHEKTQA